MSTQYQRLACREPLDSEREQEMQSALFASIIAEMESHAESQNGVDIQVMRSNFYWNLVNYRNAVSGMVNINKKITRVGTVFLYGFQMLLHGGNFLMTASSLNTSHAIANSTAERCADALCSKECEGAWERLDNSIRTINSLVFTYPGYISLLEKADILFTTNDKGLVVVDVKAHLDRLRMSDDARKICTAEAPSLDD